MLRWIITLAFSYALLARLPLALFAYRASVPQSSPAFRSATVLVLVNVVAPDKKGNLVRDLKQQDFTVLEDGQKQQVASFQCENIDELAHAQQTVATVTGASSQAPAAVAVQSAEHAAD